MQLGHQLQNICCVTSNLIDTEQVVLNWQQQTLTNMVIFRCTSIKEGHPWISSRRVDWLSHEEVRQRVQNQNGRAGTVQGGTGVGKEEGSSTRGYCTQCQCARSWCTKRACVVFPGTLIWTVRDLTFVCQFLSTKEKKNIFTIIATACHSWLFVTWLWLQLCVHDIGKEDSASDSISSKSDGTQSSDAVSIGNISLCSSELCSLDWCVTAIQFC